MMKRILLVSPFPPGLGGISVSSQRLYDCLWRDGYKVDKYNIRYRKPLFNNPVCLAVRYAFIPIYILFQKRYDIIHFHVPGVTRKSYVSLFKFAYKRAKVIFTLHGDIKKLITDKIFLWALSKADKIICVQEGDSQLLPNELALKSVDNPAFIMPAYINDDELSNTILNFAKRKDTPMMLFYGAVRLQNDYYDLYGIHDVLQLYNDLKRNGMKVRLLMFITYNIQVEAESFFIKNIRSIISDDEDVLMVENNNSSIVGLYKYADVYLRLTKTDGDSLAIREALAMGCPVVASNVSSRPKQCITYNDSQDLYSTTLHLLTHKQIHESIVPVNYYEVLTSIYNSL